MAVLSIIFAFAAALSILALERWFGSAGTRKRDAAIEDRLFRRGLMILLRSSAALAAGAGIMKVWQAFPALPQAASGRIEGVLITLAIIATVAGGGKMVVGLWIAQRRFRKTRPMDLSLTMRIVLVMGSVTLMAGVLPVGVTWMVYRIG